jgi:hypothetical protein
LKDQKINFIEHESKKLNSRVEELYNENKELAKRLQEAESELK